MGLFSRRSDQVVELREQLYQQTGNVELLQERLMDLELELDEGWTRLSVEGQNEFSRDGLRKIVQLARIMFLKNPLIQRAVTVQAFYTWAQGAEPQTEDDSVNEVVQRFLDDKGNRRAFWGEQARLLNDVTLANDGNLFFVLFPNAITGHVRIRTIPVDEMQDIITNPADRSEPWFYRREWIEHEPQRDGTTRATPKKALYPAMGHMPRVQAGYFGELEVKWDSPIYHIKVGGLAGMRFGVPETYAAHSWARAYKSFLEDWASLVRSLSRFAWRITTKNKKVAAAKQKLATTIGPDTGEGNPPGATGAAFVGDDQVSIDAIPKTGATTSAQDGKQLRLMVASAMNIPDTILSGDVDQGNLATAKTLDRPTELAFQARQGMWKEALEDILEFVVAASVLATRGRLKGTVTVDEDGLTEIVVNGVEDASVTLKFPPILADDKVAEVQAITSAATLDGKANANTIPAETLSLMLLTALGEDNVDEILEQLATEKDEAEAAAVQAPVVAALKEAIRELRESRAA